MKTHLVDLLDVSPKRLALLAGACLLLSLASQMARAEVESTRLEGSESALDSSTDMTSGEGVYPIVLNYTNILYGPSLQSPSSFLPSSDGKPDTNRPIFMKNFLSASYRLNQNWALTASAYWLYRPVLGQSLTMQDPFVRISDAAIVHTAWGLNLYGDLRVHMGVTSASRDANYITGFQNFNYLTFQPDNGRLILALRASARYNVFGKNGYGPDAEFYLAPEANFRMSSKVALTLLYEMGADHQVGDKFNYLTNDGTDLEPGFEWDPTPDIVVNPYLTLLTGGKVNLASTSVGMFFTWTFL